ncbi:MAG: hypothetical protein IPN33_23585 [Saprospiraceae bacterium]|nr:hypothetical protein [Saprospiraceae bacterium]
MQVMDQGAKVIDFLPFDNIGSGGDIIWNPSQGGILGLGHEVGHAYDSNFGALDSREVNINGGSEERREIRAVYHENRIRQDLGKSLRERYVDGPKLIDGNKQPINSTPPLLQKLMFRF